MSCHGKGVFLEQAQKGGVFCTHAVAFPSHTPWAGRQDPFVWEGGSIISSSSCQNGDEQLFPCSQAGTWHGAALRSSLSALGLTGLSRFQQQLLWGLMCRSTQLFKRKHLDSSRSSVVVLL